MGVQLNAGEGKDMTRPQVLKIPGKSALVELERHREQYSATGLYPILFGDADDFGRINNDLEKFDPAETLAESRLVDAEEWFRQQPLNNPELYQFEEGDWPAWNANPTGIITHLDLLTNKPLKEVFLGLLEIQTPWEAFAHLNWGSWNDCPAPAEHCAIHRYWAAKYGAEVVSITGDIVQCTVARPPVDRSASLLLARQQYIYCYDIVDQGTQTIAALAAELLNSNTWYFWWD